MLKVMRENVQSKLIKGLLWAVILSFVAGIFMIWGRGQTALEGDPNIIAEVAGIQLDRYTFEQRYQQEASEAKDKQSRIKAAQNVIYGFIREQLWLKEAERLGMTTSSKELYNYIMNYKDPKGNYVFRDNDGRFVGDRMYQEIIRENVRTSVADFEAKVKEDIMLRKLQNLLLSGVEVSDKETLTQYKIKNEKVTIKLAKFETESFLNAIPVERSDLEQYFNNNKEKFRRPLNNKYEVAVVPLSYYLGKVQVDNKKVREYYDSHIENYYVKEQRQARHILLRLKPDADKDLEEKVRKNAETILELAKAGKDFSTLATRFSEDETTAANGGLLPYSLQGAMQKPFDDELFGMKIDEIRGPVRTDFGFHIIKLVGIKPAGYKPFLEVRDEVASSLRKAESEELRDSKLGEIEEKLKDSDNWDKTAKELGIVYSTTTFIPPGAIPPGVPFSQELFQITAEMGVGDITKPIRGTDDVVFLKLVEQRESHIPKIDEVIKDVERMYREEQAVLLVKKNASEALDKIKNSVPFEEAVLAAGGKFENPKPFAADEAVENIGRIPELNYSAFRASQGNLGGPFEFWNGCVFYQLISKVDYDFAKFLQESEQLKRELFIKKQELILNAYFELAAKGENFQVNNKLLQEILR